LEQVSESSSGKPCLAWWLGRVPELKSGRSPELDLEQVSERGSGKPDSARWLDWVPELKSGRSPELKSGQLLSLIWSRFLKVVQGSLAWLGGWAGFLN
jgi:hypothetical protein